jgi:hypothetical protein
MVISLETLHMSRMLGDKPEDFDVIASNDSDDFLIECFLGLVDKMTPESIAKAVDRLPKAKKADRLITPVTSIPAFELLSLSFDFGRGTLEGFLEGSSTNMDGEKILEGLQHVLKAYKDFDKRKGDISRMELDKGKLYIYVESSDSSTKP